MKFSRKFEVFILSLGVLIALPQLAQAKDMAKRLGVGVKSNGAIDLPQLAAVYYMPDGDIGLTGGLGIDSEDQNSRFAANVGVRRILYKEPHLNFYFGGHFGLVNYEKAGDKNSGYELDAIFGAEFFLNGLESIGFTFEGGAGILSTSKVRFRTIADHPMKAGVIFYF